MGGNVWEWCRTKYDQPDDNSLDGDVSRVERGGAFYSDVRDVRCAARGGDNPYVRSSDLGFRVLVSPFS
jgi:formylglycine-generating enzyme required for sulfatase activity